MLTRRVFAMLLLALLMGACAAPMKQITPTQQTEAAFEAAKRAEAEKKAAELRAKSDATAAENARRSAGKSFAAAIQQEAVAAEARLAAIRAEAEAQRRKACELDPDLCPKAAPPPLAQSVPPVAVPAPPPPPPDQFVDIEITSDWAAPKRISPYPSGWELVFGGDKDDTLILRVNGVVKSSLKRGSALGCWCFREQAVERCPIR